MAESDRLVVAIPDLDARVKGLFDDIRDDPDFLKGRGDRLVSAVIEKVVPEYKSELSSAKLSTANQFLQSALSNEKFRLWAAEYQKGLAEAATQDIADGKPLGFSVDKKVILEDIGKALIESGDSKLIANYSENLLGAIPGSQFSTFVVTDDIAAVTKGIALLLVVVTAIDATPLYPDVLKRDFVAAGDVRAIAETIVVAASARSE